MKGHTMSNHSHHHAAPLNPQELTRAQQMWGFFARYAKYGAIICTLLVAFVVWVIQ
jgi:hypothetical protein